MLLVLKVAKERYNLKITMVNDMGNSSQLERITIEQWFQNIKGVHSISLMVALFTNQPHQLPQIQNQA